MLFRSMAAGGFVMEIGQGTANLLPLVKPDHIRVYANNTLTITSTQKISKIEFITVPNYECKSFTSTVGEFDNTTGTWVGEAQNIVFKNEGQNIRQIRITGIRIYFAN